MAIEPFLRTRPQLGFFLTGEQYMIVEAVVVLAMVAAAFSYVEVDVIPITAPAYKTLPCYFALFALASLFTLYSTLDALWNRNIIELVGMCLFSAGLCVFSGLQIVEVRDALVVSSSCASRGFATCALLFRMVERFLIVVPAVIAIALCSYAYWTRQLFYEFGWAVFHTIGANPRMKYMYRFYEVFVCLLKFDYFCVLALTMQLLILVQNTTPAEEGVTIAAIPVSLIVLIGCGFAVRKEIKWLMLFSLTLMLAAMAYIVYKITRFYGPHAANYATTRSTLTFFSIVTILMLGASFIIGVRCFMFFGEGLIGAHEGGSPEKRRKARLFRQHSEHAGGPWPAAAEADKQNGVEFGERRMSIE